LGRASAGNANDNAPMATATTAAWPLFMSTCSIPQSSSASRFTRVRREMRPSLELLLF
jgi:hypothetical protein